MLLQGTCEVQERNRILSHLLAPERGHGFLFTRRRHGKLRDRAAGIRLCCLAVLINLSAVSQPGFAQQKAIPDTEDEQAIIDRTPQDERVRIYRTPQERREAGRKRELTDWFTLSGLFELEYNFQRFSLSDTSNHTHNDDVDAFLQLGLEVSPFTWMTAELIYQFFTDSFSNWRSSDRHTLDEATVSLEASDFELIAGKQYLPFGVYFSRFVSAPLLEFGETRDRGVTLSYVPNDRLGFSAFAYTGQAKKVGSKGSSWDWGMAAEVSPSEYGSFGVSYLSDLADSQEGLLDDFNDRYETRVDALSAFATIEYDHLELTAELVSALDSFEELDSDRDKPRAWNVELAFYPEGDFEWALRLEGSDELEDAPRLQGGASVAWRITRYASATIEYLRGSYKAGLAEDEERELDKVNQFGALMSFEF